MLQLGLAIASDAAVQQRYERAIREKDQAAINACRLELAHRRPFAMLKGN
jgi:hypothetical protein